tara:strand:+ start:21676 stop:24186 length:2511 start_codon:yes stop_codon:yes gene_type:complete
MVETDSPRSGDDTKPELLRRLTNIRFQLSRASLNAWINPTVLNCDESLGISQDDAVAYVLPHRSLADLLVVDHAVRQANLRPLVEPLSHTTEDRSFFFLGHPEGWFGRRARARPSPRMDRLLASQHELSQDILVLPVSVFWGHQPSQEKSLVRLILSENWTATSRLRKFLAILFLRNHILVEFSRPLSLRDLIRTGDGELLDPQRQRRKLMRVLRVHFARQRQAIVGPDLSHRRTLINRIVTTNHVQEVVSREAAASNRSVDVVTRTAAGYAHEIVSHQSYRVIRLFNSLLGWLWNHIYDGIDVHHVDTLRSVGGTHEIIYVPCHRSHIDYLLLSYVLYHNGLTPPHVAAGENLNLPIIGGLLRRGGAFFMRRSFREDLLYRAVFDEYLHQIFIKGYSVEYFVEGSRSRTGRMLTPKTGMLAMTMRSFVRDDSKPIAFVPVYFNYQKVIESPTYLRELTGSQKKPESVFDIFRVFATFKHAFGRVAVSFGTPLMLPEHLDETTPDWREIHVDDPQWSKVNRKLAMRLVTLINKAASVGPVNLVSTALLSTRRQTMAVHHLHGQLNVLAELARQAPVSPAPIVSDQDPSHLLSATEEIIGVERWSQGLGDVVNANQNTSILMTYYRNSTLHWFILPGLLCRLMRVHRSMDLGDIFTHVERLYPFVQAELFLPWQSTDLRNVLRHYLVALEHLNLLNVDEETVTACDPASTHYATLTTLAELADPTLERCFIVLGLLTETPMPIADVQTRAAAVAEYLASIYGINSPDFFDASLFASFINALSDQGLLALTEDDGIRWHDDLIPLQQTIGGLINSEFNNYLQHALQMSTVPTAGETTA